MSDGDKERAKFGLNSSDSDKERAKSGINSSDSDKESAKSGLNSSDGDKERAKSVLNSFDGDRERAKSRLNPYPQLPAIENNQQNLDYGNRKCCMTLKYLHQEAHNTCYAVFDLVCSLT